MFKTSVQKLQLSVGTKQIKQDRGYRLIFIKLKTPIEYRIEHASRRKSMAIKSCF